MCHRQIQITTTVPDSDNRTRSWRRYLAGLLVLIAIALLPASQALPPPPPGGSYPGFNTALGTNSLKVNTTGQFNTAIGFNALQANTTGNQNTAFGLNTMLFNTTGSFNMGIGGGCLRNNIEGNNNTAIGFQAMSANKASNNVAIGYQALFNNTTGVNNTASGSQVLFSNTTGNDNTGIGSSALIHNTTGTLNTATGNDALGSNTSGSENTATGVDALHFNTTGDENTATGYLALFNNTNGFDNTATGYHALFNNTTGSANTAIGDGALFNNTTGDGNTAIGFGAGQRITAGVLNIDISNDGAADDSRVIRIGTFGTQTKAFIAGIRGATTGNMNAVPVLIDSAGQLGTISSSRRFKKEIKPMNQISEAIHALKPVTFHYKGDATSTPQFGLIAEEVAEVNPDLVVRDEKGEIYTVRYDAVNAMLLNEFLKEHKMVQEQGVTITKLKKEIAGLTASVKEQAAQIQKVSARLEAGKPALQVAANQ